MGAKVGRCHQPSSHHRDNRHALGLPHARLPFVPFVPPLIKGALELVNISKTKVDPDSPVLVA
jgi:hypothetical protein